MSLPVYEITIDESYAENGEDLGIDQIAFTSKPAIIVKGLAFNSDAKQLFFKDDVKMRIAAPAMIPMNIYRREDDGFEYEVKFTEQEVERIFSKFMGNLTNKNVFNLEHNSEKTVPAYVLEAWIVQSEDPKEDNAYKRFGVEVPKGSVFIVSQITDKDYYNSLVEQGQVGYSIEGFLGMKLSEQLNQDKMKKQEMNVALPDGEHEIQGKIYVVKDGVVIEVKEKEEMAEEKEEEKVEEVAASTEEVKEEEMADEPAAPENAPATQAFVQEMFNQLFEVIAELKVELMESKEAALEEDKTEDVKMSVADFRMNAIEKLKNKITKK
jgi:hypothetical protein